MMLVQYDKDERAESDRRVVESVRVCSAAVVAGVFNNADGVRRRRAVCPILLARHDLSLFSEHARSAPHRLTAAAPLASCALRVVPFVLITHLHMLRALAAVFEH